MTGREHLRVRNALSAVLMLAIYFVCVAGRRLASENLKSSTSVRLPWLRR